MDPSDDGDEGGLMFPTGNLVDGLEVPESPGTLKATMITAGIPTVFVNAEDIGYTGTELREDINTDPEAPAFRSHPRGGALRMGLIKTPEEAATRQHTPRSPSWRRPPPTRYPAARPLKPAMWTCWCARCRWANCTTP